MKIFRRFSSSLLKRACEVCVASDMLRDDFNRFGYDFKAEGKAEFSPAKMWFRRAGEKRWGEPIFTFDLAGTVNFLGLQTTVMDASDLRKRSGVLSRIYKTTRNVPLSCCHPTVPPEGVSFTQEIEE